MDREIMKHDNLENIPVLTWKGNPLIGLEEGKFMTVKPIGKGVRTLEIAKRMAKQFGEMYKCDATVTNDEEWIKAIHSLGDDNTKMEFLKMNDLESCEALLVDSKEDGSKHVLVGGKAHGLNEIFHGFISDFDAKGKIQPTKLVFFTITFETDLIEYVS